MFLSALATFYGPIVIKEMAHFHDSNNLDSRKARATCVICSRLTNSSVNVLEDSIYVGLACPDRKAKYTLHSKKLISKFQLRGNHRG